MYYGAIQSKGRANTACSRLALRAVSSGVRASRRFGGARESSFTRASA